MKKCPTCEKTFEDSMRFCQADGTQLVAVAETIDPYKTMVARPDEIASAIPARPVEKPVTESPKAFVPPQEEGDVLQIPKASDPMKTQVVSEEEIRREMASGNKPEEPVIEIPPARETPTPPAFIDADLNPVKVPPPVSPAASASNASTSEPPVGQLTSPPIPSPFGSPRKSAADVSPMVPQYKEPEPKVEVPPSIPSFDEPVEASTPFEAQAPSTPFQAQTPSSPFDQPSPSSSPFDEPPVVQPMASTPPVQQMAQAEWTPPPVPESSWQPTGGGSGQGAPPAAAGQSKTLAIISLVCGILGVTLCCGWFIVSIVGLVLGLMARGKANSDPAHYGGAGLAMGGIITGALGLIGGVILWIVYIFYFAAIMSQIPR